jgi:hypothetical protein
MDVHVLVVIFFQVPTLDLERSIIIGMKRLGAINHIVILELILEECESIELR